MPSIAQKVKGWCFTINNPTDQDRQDLETLKDIAQYYVYGEEEGCQGTFHFQGYVHLSQPKTLSQLKRILKRAHLETRRGSVKQAIEYCKKDGQFHEYGDRPKSAAESTKDTWRAIIEHAERGDMEWIKHEQPSIYVRYFERLRSLCRRPSVVLQGDLKHEWWYGSTGSGKSRTLWSMYPGHYAKELNKWWDGYNGEEVVAIEEWAPKNECTASFLKIWADRYPFPAQIKGGTLSKIRPEKIIVLSNYTIDQCFPNAEDRDPIKRRFKVIHFPFTFTNIPEDLGVEELERLLEL